MHHRSTTTLRVGKTLLPVLDRHDRGMSLLTLRYQSLHFKTNRVITQRIVLTKNYDGQSRISNNRKSWKQRQADRNRGNDSSSKSGTKPSEPSNNSTAHSAVEYHAPPVFHSSSLQVPRKSNQNTYIVFTNPPPGMQHAIFPNGQHE